MNNVIMHVNFGELRWNYYGRKSIEDIVKMAAKIGFDGIEFRDNPPVELSHLSYEEYVTEIARCKEKYGLKQILMAANLAEATGKPKDERDKEIERVLKCVEFANKTCGTTVFNAFAKAFVSDKGANLSVDYHGSAAATEKDWEETVEVFKIAAKRLEELGVKFAFETHMRYLHDTPAASKKLVDLIDSPAIGINMDYGNTVYFKEYPTVEETIDLYGDKLFYTHLKNSVPKDELKRTATALSSGEINHRNYIRKLKETGFSGPIGIEAPRVGDREWYALEDFTYFKMIDKETD